jgi:hypothetical protein
MPALPYWLFPGDDRPTEEIDDEIAEELQLHLDLLAEEQERRGLTPEEAKQKAAERFGDFNQLLRRCRREKQGDVPMLKRVQAVLTGLLLLGAIVVGWQQARIWNRMDATWLIMNGFSARLSDMNDKLVLLEPSSSDPTEDDVVAIQVVDESGAAIKNATLTFGWTDASRSYFDSYVISTDDQGNFETPLTFREKQLESVTAYVPGYAFVSESLNRPFRAGETLTLKLSKAVKQRLKLVAPGDAEHLLPRPLTNSDVRITSRTPESGRSNDSQWLQLRLRTDSEGVVEIDCAADGDDIQLTAWEPSNTWVAGPIAIKAMSEGQTSELLTIKLRPMSPPNGFRSGGGMF